MQSATVQTESELAQGRAIGITQVSVQGIPARYAVRSVSKIPVVGSRNDNSVARHPLRLPNKMLNLILR